MHSIRKPVSEKQLAANRANALKSTGPTSPDGRARSARNSRKHGFAAAQFSIPGSENPEELLALREDLITLYQPVNSQELFAIEQIAVAQQQILRAARFEAGVFGSSNSADPYGNMELAQKFPTRASGGYAYLDFGLILRYQAQAERQYRRWVEEFERLKKLRAELAEEIPNEPILETESERSEDLPPAPCPQSLVSASPNEPISTREATPTSPQSLAPSPKSPAFSPRPLIPDP